MQKPRGGKREGSGAKCKDANDKKHPVTIYVPYSVITGETSIIASEVFVLFLNSVMSKRNNMNAKNITKINV